MDLFSSKLGQCDLNNTQSYTHHLLKLNNTIYFMLCLRYYLQDLRIFLYKN